MIEFVGAELSNVGLLLHENWMSEARSRSGDGSAEGFHEKAEKS